MLEILRQDNANGANPYGKNSEVPYRPNMNVISALMQFIQIL